jgi:hypothetical protein
MKRKAALCFAVVAIIAGCNRTVINYSKSAETFQCEYAKEVCKQCDEYQQRYLAMKGDERKEGKELLRSYQSQCGQAIKACGQSQRK